MLKTLQIATVGEDIETVLIGLRNVPSHRLDLICELKDHTHVEEFAHNLRHTLKMQVEVHVVNNNIVESVLEEVATIVKQCRNHYDDFVLNVAGGDKTLTCAGVSAAFFNGLKAFHLMGETPVLLPILKVNYSTVISDAKKKILKSIRDLGGTSGNLGELSEQSGFGKPLLSYHIRGDDESKGLVDLGLVEAKHKRRGRLQVELTTLGRAMLFSY
ncbi:MAG: HFX_2341 family transcriptional regulator domain-containing protein [Candidatus Thorarchaeota archaeon]|jgi:hypothetical protein